MTEERQSDIQSLVDQIEVSIQFDVGMTTLPIGEFKSIQPGFIFQLERDPQNPISIKVNGAEYGRGQPVLVDGKLAIQLTERSKDD